MITLPNPHAVIGALDVAASEAIDGHRQPSEIWAAVKVLEKGIERLKEDDQFKDAVIQEVARYGAEGISFFGLTLTKKNGAGSSDFSRTSAIEDRIRELEEMKALAKSLPEDSGPVPYPRTGELVYPAIRIGGSETVNATRANE